MKFEDLEEVCDFDLDDYFKFYKYVKSNMENKDWLSDMSREVVSEIINEGGKIFLYTFQDEIVCSMMYIPTNNKSLKKYDINYDCNIVASCGPMLVSPKYIGNKLQLAMLKRLDRYASLLGKTYIFTKASPDNIYSINNIIDDGYQFIKTYKSSHGSFKNIYLKKLGD